MDLTIFRQRSRAIFLTLIFGVALGEAAHGYRKPRNPRRAKRQGAETVSKSTEAAAAARGPWNAGAAGALEALIAERGAKSPRYNERKPPVAVVVWSEVGLSGDSAEAVFYQLVTNAEFKFSEDFWRQIPLGYGNQKIRAAYEQFHQLPKSVWDFQPAYRQYRKFFFESYQRMCANVGRKECRGYLAQLLIGFTQTEAHDYARAAIERELAIKPRVEKVGEDDRDLRPVRWQRGLVVVPQVKALIKRLREEGFDVWALGLEPQEVLEESAVLGGVDPSRCLGIKQLSEREVLSGRVIEPVPIRAGQIEAVVSSVGRPPVLVLAAGEEDANLLSYGEGVRIVIGPRTVGRALLQAPFL